MLGGNQSLSIELHMIHVFAAVQWGAPRWVISAVVVVVAAAILGVARSYWRAARGTSGWGGRGWGLTAALFKVAGILALALCVLEPLQSGTQARPGENLFLLLADNSRSLQIRDQQQSATRGDRLRQYLAGGTPWQTKLEQDFQVRRYLFDTRLRPVRDFSALALDGNGSALAASLASLAERHQGRPNAGILLFTDGIATDFPATSLDWSKLPPIYPVLIGDAAAPRDISLRKLSVSQTNFEAAPVTVQAEISATGYQEPIVVQLVDEQGREIEQQLVTPGSQILPAVRFRFCPERRGISFYRVLAYAQSEGPPREGVGSSQEATLLNNSRIVMVDRGGGPYRVLYVSGRPNWEFKFLRRALESDDELNLVGLIRIARREPKFTFRGRAGERTNPLFRGFGNDKDEEAEQYDQPVLIRVGTKDPEELRDGFPKSAEELFRYHGLILDDVEAAYFNPDQMSLIQRFVSQRGGGFLMLGGQESFQQGQYARTPIGELLPVYLDRAGTVPTTAGWRLVLTRDGWLQPWVRVRANEPDEQLRLSSMPGFLTLNAVEHVKPGATVLAEVAPESEGTVSPEPEARAFPALVAQPFGKGRAAALLVGDLWRWQLKRKPDQPEDDLAKSWRQTVRWLVADVPQRIEVEAAPVTEDPNLPMRLNVTVRDETFEPLDNASVRIKVKTPDAREIEIQAEPSTALAGTYVATIVPRVPGAYRAVVSVSAVDGSPVGERETSWAAEPAADELSSLEPNRQLVERLAQQTGGEVISADRLDRFVTGLPNRKVPISEQRIFPLWHQWPIFLISVACLLGEWTVRRWKGLP